MQKTKLTTHSLKTQLDNKPKPQSNQQPLQPRNKTKKLRSISYNDQSSTITHQFNSQQIIEGSCYTQEQMIQLINMRTFFQPDLS